LDRKRSRENFPREGITRLLAGSDAPSDTLCAAALDVRSVADATLIDINPDQNT
jgi:hypothetical protein